MSAEIFKMSGVIAILVVGIFMAHYMFYNLSATAKVTTGVTFQTISLVAEAFLYVYLGISSWEYKGKSAVGSPDLAWSWTFVLLQFGTLFIARFASVFGTSWLFMICKGVKNWRLNTYETSIIWFAGTIRGAIAFALIQTIPDPPHGDEVRRHANEVIKSTTLFIVVISTVVLGALMPPFIKFRLGQMAKRLPYETSEIETKLQDSVAQNNEDQGESSADRKYKSKTQSHWKRFDEGFLKPFFIFDYVNRKDEIKLQKRKLKYNSDSFDGGNFLRSNLKRRDSYYQSILTENKPNLNDDDQEQESLQMDRQPDRRTNMLKLQNDASSSDFMSSVDRDKGPNK